MTDGKKALGHLKDRRPAARAVSGPARHTVTLIPGDTVGEEMADAVVRIVAATGVSLAWDRCPSGQRAMAQHGTPLPEALFESIEKNKVALKGILLPPAGSGDEPNLALRRRLGLFASVRQARNIPGLPSRYENVDIVVIRESTEDLYAGIEHEVVPGVVESLKVVTEAASMRIARFAFEHAVRHGRRSVTAVHKANIMKMSDGLFLECCRRTAREFPGIEYRDLIADNCVMQLVLNPQRFDVMLMGNMLGDIISDLCAGLVGGPGTVPAVSSGPGATVFEAIHGNAPHLEGEDRAGLLPLLVPAVAMLSHLGEDEAARRIDDALGRVLADAETLTPDLGGAAHTSEMAQAIIQAMTVG